MIFYSEAIFVAVSHRSNRRESSHGLAVVIVGGGAGGQAIPGVGPCGSIPSSSQSSAGNGEHHKWAVP